MHSVFNTFCLQAFYSPHRPIASGAAIQGREQHPQAIPKTRHVTSRSFVRTQGHTHSKILRFKILSIEMLHLLARVLKTTGGSRERSSEAVPQVTEINEEFICQASYRSWDGFGFTLNHIETMSAGGC